MTLRAINCPTFASRLSTMTGLSAIALSTLTGCPSKDDTPETIKPLAPPPPHEVETPDTPHDQLGECFDPRGFTGVKFTATDAMYPGGVPVDGSFITELDRQTLCLTGDPCARDNNGDEFKLQSDDPNIINVEGMLRWMSTPWELHRDNPNALKFGDVEYTEVVKRAGDRVSGEPLSKLKFNQRGFFVSWGDDVYPDYANTHGLIYFVTGEVNTENCSYEFIIWPGVKTLNGHEQAPVDTIPIPIYLERFDKRAGLATKDMANENIVMVPLNAGQGITIRGTEPNQAVDINTGDATVGTLQGELVVVERRVSDAGAGGASGLEEPGIAGAGGAGGVSLEEEDAGGIAPLDPPDAGN